MSIHQVLNNVLNRLVTDVGGVVDVRSVGGGCISDAYCVSVQASNNGPGRLFVKRNDESFLSNFRCERDGLVRLLEPDAIRVPRPIAVEIADGSSWLVTEWIDVGPQGRDFFGRFGRGLANLHRQTEGTVIGLDQDNFLGSARQVNTTEDGVPFQNWPEFVAENRIGFQIRWAESQGLASESLADDCAQIIRSMDCLLDGRDDRASLLHGDLWSGNYLCDGAGDPVIVDPAAHYGCREAEFGMLRLFGSCPDEFYDAYNDSFPMPSGWQRRVNVYVLYHLLNHLNLFGVGYLGQCQSVATEILRS